MTASAPGGVPAPAHANGNPNEAAPPVLTLSGITAGYADFTALWDVTIEVHEGSVVALVGPNGAGKTTLLKVASGLLRPKLGAVLLDGVNVTKQSATQRSRAGICLIPEGRGIYQSLTVKENLQLDIPVRASLRAIDRAFEAFPILGARLNQRAGSLSGGEQQMLALSRAYLSEPRVVLLDELSMGLAPLVVDAILSSLQSLIASGVAILIVEQFVRRALAMADSVTVLVRGRSVFQGQPESLTESELAGAYLGVTSSQYVPPPSTP